MWPGNMSQKIYCVYFFMEGLAEAALILMNAEKKENKTCMSITFPLKVFCIDRIIVWHGTKNKSEIQRNWHKPVQYIKKNEMHIIKFSYKS